MEQNKLTLGSLFDGSGGFPLGGLISGITPVWASEIEPFPIRVTTKRLLFMKHYGDVSRMDGGKIEPVDIITFGSPCQDMSIAGKRAGLAGSRSNLFYEAIRIVKEMRCKTKDTKFILLDLRSGRPPERSWQTISVSHGGYLMRSTGEFPNAENVSTLSQILQAGVPEKYYLSPKACLGILRRASVRGKELPELLKKALERQAASA